jgi:hypothetical protein
MRGEAMSSVRTLAESLIRRRYIDRGDTTKIIVVPVPGCGLPDQFIEAGIPVPIDLLAGRPINIDMDNDGIGVDLCFNGPPARCRFPWWSVLLVQDVSGKPVQTQVVTVAMVMEDGSRVPIPPRCEIKGIDVDGTEPSRPGLTLIKGGG